MGQSLVGDLPDTFAWRWKSIGLSGSCHEQPSLQRHPPSEILRRQVTARKHSKASVVEKKTRQGTDRREQKTQIREWRRT